LWFSVFYGRKSARPLARGKASKAYANIMPIRKPLPISLLALRALPGKALCRVIFAHYA
jgi:hypothetical protein